MFDTTQITSQFTTTVQTQITSNSCPASQLGHSINATGFLGCQYPTNNAYTYVNNSQVSTTHGVTTPVQVGMKISYTPTTSSIYVSASAGGQTNLISCGISEQLDYGTGPAPGQGAAQTGTLIGDAASFFFTYTGNQYNIPLLGLVTGLTPGTTYWFDIAFSSAPGAGGCGTATWSTATVVFLSV